MNLSNKNKTIKRKKTSTYTALICMNMASEYNVDLILYKPWFVHNSHRFALHVVVVITIVPWWMHENDKPRGLRSIYFRQLSLEPLVLRSVFPLYKEKMNIWYVMKKQWAWQFLNIKHHIDLVQTYWCITIPSKKW